MLFCRSSSSILLCRRRLSCFSSCGLVSVLWNRISFKPVTTCVASPTLINFAKPYYILKTLLAERKLMLAELILPSCLKFHGMSDVCVCKIIAYYLCLHDVKKALVFLTIMNERRFLFTLPIDVFMMLINDKRYLDVYELLMMAGDNLPCLDVFHYSIIVDGLCKDGHIDKALDVCNLAKKNGVSLNIVTYNTVLNGLCRHGCLIEAFRLFNSLDRINVLPTEVTYGTLIDTLVNQGRIVDAKMLFNEMFLKNLKPNTHIYNSLLNGFCKANQLVEATKLFEDLEAQKVEADNYTVAAVMNCYCLKGDMEGALELFFRFRTKGVLPDVVGFMHLLRGLCAKGRMEEARSITRYMLDTPSVIDVLKKVEIEAESDSVVNLVSMLCEQGRISEAVSILDEIESIFFKKYVPRKEQPERKDSELMVSEGDASVSDSEEVDDVEVLKNFDSVYPAIESLCMEGEIGKANRLAKLLMKS